MKLFEYKLEKMPRGAKSIHAIEMILDNLGLDGWELCGIDYGCFILKREIPED